MKAVGELDQDDPDVLDHREEHLAQVLGLHFLLRCRLVGVVRRELDLLQLCHPVDEQGDIGAELLLNLLFCIDGVLHDVVEKACRNRLLVHLQVCQDDGDIERMDDVGLPGLSLLSLVGLCRIPVCLLDQADVIGGMVLAHPIDQIPVQVLGGEILGEFFDVTVVEMGLFGDSGRHFLLRRRLRKAAQGVVLSVRQKFSFGLFF